MGTRHMRMTYGFVALGLRACKNDAEVNLCVSRVDDGPPLTKAEALEWIATFPQDRIVPQPDCPCEDCTGSREANAREGRA